jgi:hypothetical protein
MTKYQTSDAFTFGVSLRSMLPTVNSLTRWFHGAARYVCHLQAQCRLHRSADQCGARGACVGGERSRTQMANANRMSGEASERSNSRPALFVLSQTQGAEPL